MNLPDITKEIKFIKELVKLNNDDPLFKNDSIEYILTYKWKEYGEKEFLNDCLF